MRRISTRFSATPLVLAIAASKPMAPSGFHCLRIDSSAIRLFSGTPTCLDGDVPSNKHAPATGAVEGKRIPNSELPTDKRKEQLQALHEFTTQAVAGAVMAIYRVQKGKIPSQGFQQICLKMVVQYLNVCWMGLLKADDPFILTCVDGMSQGQHSPICVVQAVFAVAKAVVPKTTPQVPAIAGEQPSDQETQQFRQQVTTEIAASASQFLASHDPFDHTCAGPALETIRMDWKEAGAPDHAFFQIKKEEPNPSPASSTS